MTEERLWNVPSSWCWTQLGVLGEIVSGGTPSTKEPSFWGREINWITPADLTGYSGKTIAKGAKGITKIGLTNSSAKLMPAGSVHFSSRAPIGYVVISAEPMCTNQGFKSLVPRTGVFNQYVYYYLKSAKSLARERASGTTFLELSGSAFARLPIPLPPENEQRRIVAKIEELFSELEDGIRNLNASRERLTAYRHALLKHAFEGKLTAKWRSENKQNLKFADVLYGQLLTARREAWEKSQKRAYKRPIAVDRSTTLPSLPAEWRWVSLDELISGEPRSLQSGPFGSNLKHSEFQNEGILVVGIDNVGDGTFSMGSENRISAAKFKELQKYQARPGDLLITVMASLGRTCVVPPDLEPAIITKHVYRVTMSNEFLLSEFYNLVLQSPTISRGRMLQSAQGQTRPGLNGSILREIPLPLCSLEEQREILIRLREGLSGIDRFEGDIVEQLQKSELLRQGILKMAFSGRLVAQSPEDGSTLELLDRIQIENAAKKNSKNKNGGRVAA
jgi:type I restriction enzyme S subunit